jgi:hypothetical protein
MFISYKGRNVELGKPAQVYFNLKRKIWSIKQNGEVVGHTPAVTIRGGIKFDVSESGRQYTIKKQSRFVHAWIHGIIESIDELDSTEMHGIKYNPYENEFFLDRETLQPIESAEVVTFTSHKIAYYA